MNEFGENLRDARKKNKLSQTKLAENVGVTQQAISFYEQGKDFPMPQVYFKLCKTLKKSPEILDPFFKYREISENCKTKTYDKLTEYLIEQVINLTVEQKGQVVTFIDRLKKNNRECENGHCEKIPKAG